MIAALALRLGISRRLLVGGLILIAIVGAIVAWNVWLSNHDEAVVETDRLEANAAAREIESKAKDQAAIEKASDDLASRNAEKELDHATDALPDTMPTARRLARACQQLRAQGTDTSALPQCR